MCGYYTPIALHTILSILHLSHILLQFVALVRQPDAAEGQFERFYLDKACLLDNFFSNSSFVKNGKNNF